MRKRSLWFIALLLVIVPSRSHAQAADAPRPIDALNSVWIEELTWMEVRDAIKAGKTTAIIATGGIEPNGPYLATGKHNYVLRGTCEAIARKLGDALCAPIVAFVPEGRIDPPSGHMRSAGTISVSEETYRALLTDIASSLKVHGFKNVIFIGDSGGNQNGMRDVATAMNEKWAGSAKAWFIREYYDPGYADLDKYMNEQLNVRETANDGYHDQFSITALMMLIDPTTVRYDQRVKANLAKINGVSIAPKEQTIEIARKLVEFRADYTIRAIRAAMAGAAKE
jgi:creatinine amidohydrolase/Fe(II)-dependent formamide hydrolase-like protein